MWLLMCRLLAHTQSTFKLLSMLFLLLSLLFSKPFESPLFLLQSWINRTSASDLSLTNHERICRRVFSFVFFLRLAMFIQE